VITVQGSVINLQLISYRLLTWLMEACGRRRIWCMDE